MLTMKNIGGQGEDGFKCPIPSTEGVYLKRKVWCEWKPTNEILALVLFFFSLKNVERITCRIFISSRKYTVLNWFLKNLLSWSKGYVSEKTYLLAVLHACAHTHRHITVLRFYSQAPKLTYLLNQVWIINIPDPCSSR